MAESRLHLIAELVEESIRKDNDLLQAEVEKLQRRLHLHQNMYRILNQSHDGISANLMMMRRVLHEIFSEDPELRMAYRPVVYFSDLETDIESEDEEGHEHVWERNVNRRLSFDSDVSLIDLTEE
jgi:hypothetical protein